jgi:hypothetical protein
MCRLHLLAKASVVNRRSCVADQLLIKLGRTVKFLLLIEWQRRQCLDYYRALLAEFSFISCNPLQMIGRDGPAAIGGAFNAASCAPHRSQTADMAFRKSFAGTGVMRQMRINIIAPLIGGCDRCDGLVDNADTAAPRCDFQNRVFGNRSDPVTFADIDIMDMAIDAIDDQIMAIMIFVGKPSRDDPPRDRLVD